MGHDMMATTDNLYRTILDNLYDGVYFVDRERKITYWNKGAERITGYSAAEVVGQRCSDNILMHVDSHGTLLCRDLCPLAATMLDGSERTADVYLQHKDGHRVSINVRINPLRNEQGEIAGGVEIFTDNSQTLSAIARMEAFEKLAYLDPLTGTANRRFAEITLHARYEEFKRYRWPFGLIFIDIDRFKAINDEHGHAAGDEVLKMVAKTLKNSARSFDVVARWGGDEFIAVIANVDAKQLVATANRFRTLVEQSSRVSGPVQQVTVSIGATLARTDDSEESLLERADRLMYASKSAGKNRVTADA
jgi:diguanylate cyclase (GGDEF)-like protein/PAS domain S-box-containing protein